MRKIALFFLLFLTSSQAFAFLNCVERFEFLYFKPTIDQSHYAISSSNNVFAVPGGDPEFFPDGTRFITDTSFKPAFRLEEVFNLCNNSAFDVRFLFFLGSHAESVSGGFLFDTIGYPGNGAQRPEDTFYNGRARYKQKFNFYSLDGTFNRLTIDCCDESLFFLFGLHFAYLNVKERATSRGISISDDDEIAVSNRFKRNSRFWGIGPQLGLDYRYFINWGPWCCLDNCYLRANARASLLATYNWADLHYRSSQTGPIGVNLDNQSLWRINPCADVKIGLNYIICRKGCRMTFEIGYEFIWYCNAVNGITGYDVAFAGDTIDLYSNFSLQGPYLALGVRF